MPGRGPHRPHAVAHLLAVGRYADAVAVERGARSQADLAYFKTTQPSPIYPRTVLPAQHRLHLAVGAACEGRSAEMRPRRPRVRRERCRPEMIKQMPDMETAPLAPMVALVRFGRWDEVLALPAPPPEWLYTTGVWHYARGIAFNAKGRRPSRRARAGARWRPSCSRCPPERTVAFFFRPGTSCRWRPTCWRARSRRKAGDTASAERLLRAAVAEQDTHWFTEPPPWYFPVRQSLGASVLQAGRPAAAEAVTRKICCRNPGNGRSLLGLSDESLTAQGKTAGSHRGRRRLPQGMENAPTPQSPPPSLLNAGALRDAGVRLKMPEQELLRGMPGQERV